MDPEILIVGAGPAGSVLALQLADLGVPFRIIDKALERRAGSKALSINPATLFCLEALGCAEAIKERARSVRRATVHYRGTRYATADFSRLDGPYCAFFMLPQWQTEAVLEDALRARGISIERGNEVVGIEPSSAGVHVTTRAGLRSTRAEYRFVIGCDGAQSAVRDGLGVELSGHDFGFDLLLADVVLSGLPRPDEAHYLVEENGFCIVIPLDREQHRIVVSAERVSGAAPGFSDVCDAVARLGLPLVLREPSWVSRARCYGRLAQANHRGAVFLLGDAVHSFSPIGGFGMNTAIGDAFNLGWKLAYVCRGIAGAELLESYASERMPLARALTHNNDVNTSLIARLDRHTTADELCWLPRMSNRSFLKRLPKSLSGLAQLYAARPTGAALDDACIGSFSPEIAALASQLCHSLVVPKSDVGLPEWSGIAANFRDATALPLRLVGSERATRASLVRPDFVVEHACRSASPVTEIARALRVRYPACGAVGKSLACSALMIEKGGVA